MPGDEVEIARAISASPTCDKLRQRMTREERSASLLLVQLLRLGVEGGALLARLEALDAEVLASLLERRGPLSDGLAALGVLGAMAGLLGDVPAALVLNDVSLGQAAGSLGFAALEHTGLGATAAGDLGLYVGLLGLAHM
jgi:hypothetical protein